MLTEVKYRSFEDVVNNVKLDLKTYDLEGMIQNATLIKVAAKVNYELGIRVNPTKSAMLEVCNNKTSLPDDFSVINFALHACGSTSEPYYPEQYKSFTIVQDLLEGYNNIVHTLKTLKVVVYIYDSNENLLYYHWEVVDRDTVKVLNNCSDTLTNIKIKVVAATECFELEDHCIKHTCKSICHTYRTLSPLHITKYFDNCLDTCDYKAYIKNNFLITSFKDGNIYINYQSSMEDEEGNLIVLDHPKVNDYYELSIQYAIIKNMWFNGEDVERKLGFITEELRKERLRALTFINTPDFQTLQKMWIRNRQEKYMKYFHNLYNMEMTIKEIKIDVYETIISIVVVDSMDEARSEFRSLNPDVYEALENSVGGTLDVPGNNTYILYQKDKLSHNLIAHEIYHACDRLLKARGIDNEEAESWLIGFVSGRAYQELKDFNIQ